MNYLKIKNSAFASFALLFVLFLMSSCQKDEVLSTDQASVGLDPIAVNGVLQFRNLEHFQEYYETMNEMYDQDYEGFNQIVNNYQGVETVQIKLINDEFADPKDRYQPFLLDPVMMAIVNPNFEFQIADQVLTFLNDDYMIIANVDDAEMRSRAGSIEKGKLLKAADIPANAQITNDDAFETLLNPSQEKKEALLLSIRNAQANKTNSGCTSDSGDTGWLWQSEPGSFNWERGLSHRTKNYKSWGFSYEEAKSYGKLKLNGRWLTAKLQLWTSVTSMRYNSDCEYQHGSNDYFTEGEDKYCESCKSLRARINTNGTVYHYDFDVKGFYRTLTMNQTFLNANGSVIYD